MTAQDKLPRRPTWHFQQLPHCGTIVCVEPDGTEHVVSSGDMNSTPGYRLLNAMVRDLCEPIALQAPQPSRECLQQSTTLRDTLEMAKVAMMDVAHGSPVFGEPVRRAIKAIDAALQAAPPAPQGQKVYAPLTDRQIDHLGEQLYSAWLALRRETLRAALHAYADDTAALRAAPTQGYATTHLELVAVDAGAHIKLTIEYRGMVNEKLLSSHMVTQAKDANDIAGAHVMSAIGEINAARAAQGGAA